MRTVADPTSDMVVRLDPGFKLPRQIWNMLRGNIQGTSNHIKQHRKKNDFKWSSNSTEIDEKLESRSNSWGNVGRQGDPWMGLFAHWWYEFPCVSNLNLICDRIVLWTQLYCLSEWQILTQPIPSEVGSNDVCFCFYRLELRIVPLFKSYRLIYQWYVPICYARVML